MKRFIIFILFVLFSSVLMAEGRDTIFVVEHNLYKKISYFDNGVKKEVGFYNSDKQRVGQWTTYHSNGVICSEAFYKNDMKHGDWVFYDYEGRVMSRIQYYENKRVGTWVQYKEDGSVLSIRKYQKVSFYMGEYVRKIGAVKKTLVDEDFDFYYDFFRNKAENDGYYGDLKFTKEKGKIVFFVEIEEVDEEDVEQLFFIYLQYMEFDINKYDGVRFNSDDLMDKKIKSMLLWYEYKVIELSLTENECIELLDSIIKTMADNEWYEVSVFFQRMKLDLLLGE